MDELLSRSYEDWMLELPELDKTNLNKTINTSQRTVKERRLGLSESDQGTKFKKSARVRTTTINRDHGNFQEMVQQFTGIPSLGRSPMSRGDSSLDLDDDSTTRKKEATQQWRQLVRVNLASGLKGPPEDGYSWKKYGEKTIHGSKYPRSYYRCTHRNVQHCWSTKQVQRSDDDPTVFEITYRGMHTCNHHPAAIVPPPPPPPPPKNQTDSNASIDAAPLQINKTKTQSLDIAVDFRGRDSYRDLNDGSTPMKREGRILVRVNPASGLEWPLEDGYSWRKYGRKAILGSKYPRSYYGCTYKNVHGCLAAKQVQRSDDDPTVFEITYSGMHTCNHHPATSGNNSQATEKSISDQPFTSSVESSISFGSGLCPRSAEDQKEVKQFFGVDLLRTKAGYVANEESRPSDFKKEENVTVSSDAEKLEAMQKQRAGSDLGSMENTRDTETELFPWLMKKDADSHAALEEVHSYLMG